MGNKVTHFKYAGASEYRQGGLKLSAQGGQPLPLTRPTVWYPKNLPSASNGTPLDSDIKYLLSSIAPILAQLTAAQSVMMGACFRSVQSVAPGGTFSVNGLNNGASSTLFDSGGSQISETVAVDVVNKNPALAYDLAVRLAQKTAGLIDANLAGNYSSFTTTPQGTAGTTPAVSNLQAAQALLPITGEPVLGFFNLPTFQAMLAAGEVGPGDLIFQGNSYRSFRTIPCRSISTTGSAQPTTHNIMVLPSAMALCSADLGTATNSTGNTNITSGIPGNVQIQSSSFLDPETSVPQLVLQLVMGNSGSGNQTIYVNALLGTILLNPAAAVQVMS